MTSTQPLYIRHSGPALLETPLLNKGSAFSREERLEAGFTEEELTELANLSGEGPSKKTLTAAAKILRERHFEKRQADERTGAES